MRLFLFVLFSAMLTLSSCKQTKEPKEDTSQFDSAYPEMYTSLGLPQYRRGAIESVNGKTEGVKNIHNIIINSADGPNFLREFIHPEMVKLGWRDMKTQSRLSDIHEDDLYIATFVKGSNKYEITSSATPGGSKTRITLSVFE